MKYDKVELINHYIEAHCIEYNSVEINNMHRIGRIMHLDEIGRIIQKTRKSRKITQESLGSKLGMSRATISGIENGTIPEIGIRKILSICDALGLELLAQIKTKRPTLQQLMREGDDA